MQTGSHPEHAEYTQALQRRFKQSYNIALYMSLASFSKSVSSCFGRRLQISKSSGIVTEPSVVLSTVVPTDEERLSLVESVADVDGAAPPKSVVVAVVPPPPPNACDRLKDR